MMNKKEALKQLGFSDKFLEALDTGIISEPDISFTEISQELPNFQLDDKGRMFANSSNILSTTLVV
jgi:hypothetical protein